MAEMMQDVFPLTRSSRACRKIVSTVDPEFTAIPLFRPVRSPGFVVVRDAGLKGIIAESAEAFDRAVSGIYDGLAALAIVTSSDRVLASSRSIRRARWISTV